MGWQSHRDVCLAVNYANAQSSDPDINAADTPCGLSSGHQRAIELRSVFSTRYSSEGQTCRWGLDACQASVPPRRQLSAEPHSIQPWRPRDHPSRSACRLKLPEAPFASPDARRPEIQCVVLRPMLTPCRTAALPPICAMRFLDETQTLVVVQSGPHAERYLPPG